MRWCALDGLPVLSAHSALNALYCHIHDPNRSPAARASRASTTAAYCTRRHLEGY